MNSSALRASLSPPLIRHNVRQTITLQVRKPWDYSGPKVERSNDYAAIAKGVGFSFPSLGQDRKPISPHSGDEGQPRPA